MTNTKNFPLTVLAGTALVFSLALPALAQTTSSASTTPPTVQKAITKADTDITTRIDALTKLSTRIGDIKNLTAADKATLSSELQTQGDDLTALKAKIDADTDATTLKTDMASITADYRIYALVIPQGQIIAAADRLKTIALDLGVVGSKLQARLTAAQSAGQDVSTLQTSLTDLGAQISDAQTQAQNAVSAVTSLVPDQGDATKADANTAALKQARTALKTGTTDIQTARKDAGSILKGLQAFHLSPTASSSRPSTTYY